VKSPHTLSVANFNLHAGVNGWGQRFDIVAAAKAIDADVLVLEESFGEDGEPSQGDVIADALGYRVYEVALGRLVVRERDATKHHRSWGPRPMVFGIFSAVMPERARLARRYLDGEVKARKRGTISVVVLSRVPVKSQQIFDLPRLKRDKLVRHAIAIELEGSLFVVGTHLGHITHGSYRQMAYLGARLSELAGPSVLIGDLNCWGPPVALATRTRRAVRGRSWPAWRPHSQIDHVLLRGAVSAEGGEVLAAAGSDHRPIRATLSY
jgi:endonuclease/exonuclease/phosphatase family metal-dependent hydrolase